MSKRYLVTAGGTRERIDRVRDWGNVFTGNTGYRIARALAERGDVHLLTSNGDHLRELANQTGPLQAAPFTSHGDLRSQLAERMTRERYDAVVMTAAVSDYQPVGAFEVLERSVNADGTETWITRSAQAGKVKSTFEQLAVLGRRTEKLVDLFRGAWSYRGVLVKFKLEVGVEVDRLIEIGQASRRASGADYLVANTLDMVSGDNAGAYLLRDSGSEWVNRDDLPLRLATILSSA